MKALLIDHDDSFTENLRHWLQKDFQTVKTISYRDLDQSILNKFNDILSYDLVVISPGPKSPNDYPNTLNFLSSLSQKQAVLGVCLGFQMMATIENQNVNKYDFVKHGKTSLLKIDDSKYEKFSSYKVARYHSLHVELKPESEFQVIAFSHDDNKVMWALHKNKKWCGFQFHPESFLTEKSNDYLSFLNDWIKNE